MLLERVRLARASGDGGPLIEAIPYARFLGLSIDTSSGELLAHLRFHEKLIGNVLIPALHGGTMGALLESAAIFQLLWDLEEPVVPKTINITIDYLRSGRPRDTWAAATVTKQGRRVASVRAEAWQDDRKRPIASAHGHFLL